MSMHVCITVQQIIAYLPTAVIQNITKWYNKSKMVINDQSHCHTI